MTVTQLREFLRRQPFQKFTIRTNDGRSFEVPHPDYLWLPPKAATTVIVSSPTGVFSFVYLKNVTSVDSEGDPPVFVRQRGEDDAA